MILARQATNSGGDRYGSQVISAKTWRAEVGRKKLNAWMEIFLHRLFPYSWLSSKSLGLALNRAHTIHLEVFLVHMKLRWPKTNNRDHPNEP